MGKYKEHPKIMDYAMKMNKYKNIEKKEKIIIGLITDFKCFGEKELIEKTDRVTRAICKTREVLIYKVLHNVIYIYCLLF